MRAGVGLDWFQSASAEMHGLIYVLPVDECLNAPLLICNVVTVLRGQADRLVQQQKRSFLSLCFQDRPRRDCAFLRMARRSAVWVSVPYKPRARCGSRPEEYRVGFGRCSTFGILRLQSVCRQMSLVVKASHQLRSNALVAESLGVVWRQC